jgi:hypothetical protein
MLKKTQGVDVGDRMYIVNIHPSQTEAIEAKAADLREVAQELLDDEEETLAKKRMRFA